MRGAFTRLRRVISLVNMLGQTLSKVTLPANDQIHYQIPLQGLPKGVYIIQLETSKGMVRKKLMVVHD